MVTRFQQAVLQEMGIPLWVSQEAATPDEAAIAAPQEQASVPSQQALSEATTRSDNSSGHLAAIRQSLSDQKADKTPAASATADTPAKPPQALSELAMASAFMHDVRAAFAQTGRVMPFDVVVGDALGLTPDVLTLPSEPGKLSAADKRRLWALIVEGQTA